MDIKFSLSPDNPCELRLTFKTPSELRHYLYEHFGPDDATKAEVAAEEVSQGTKFDDFLNELEVEAKESGRYAVKELRAFERHFAQEAQKLKKDSGQ